ncbi:hypothetical protein CYME_CMR449C [Cyanidioschyzon merolae strain 10D]|uniref:FANCI solenoid 2 domain-containing protein n=1 Tax=Cyanidioschyzon merolae (strain NIES-3377 / 10D) TaxID=280699 RepID=M1UWJ9_CYAM1|nr:hypothetical protein CYME_CMR449C [Cyanidioschyzon merolae strain 10D]BAM82621.1 hypothetical protein CYME_CMR449C [Cyanidioschyzon merolae strain 10D]|eukprot:XP_005538657.1 hypothetical protein CYME_CMR449C [Cyanidioschyzon merolae strain 10D]
MPSSTTLDNIQELMQQGPEGFCPEKYRQVLVEAAQTLCNCAQVASAGLRGNVAASEGGVTLQSLFEAAELLLQRLARWVKEGLLQSHECLPLLQRLRGFVASSLADDPACQAPASSSQLKLPDGSERCHPKLTSKLNSEAHRLRICLYACCLRTMCLASAEWINRILSDSPRYLLCFPWIGDTALPMLQIYMELRERWLLCNDPTSIREQVTTTERQVQSKLMQDAVWSCDGATLTALSQLLVRILQQVLRIDWWWQSAGYDLETARDWSCVLRFVLAAAPEQALPDILCIVEMEAHAEPALGEALLASIATEVNALIPGTLSRAARLSIDLHLCFHLAEIEAIADLAREQAAALLWRHEEETAIAEAPENAPPSTSACSAEAILSRIIRLPGLEHAAPVIAELAFQWMQLTPAQKIRNFSERLRSGNSCPQTGRPDRPLAIRRRGRRRTHEQISSRSFFLQRCAVHVLTELFGHHSSARKEILSACLSAIAESQHLLATRAAYCTVIERIASSPAYRVHLRDLSESVLVWLRELMIEFPISLAKRILAALAPLGALWQPMGDGLLIFLRKLACSRAIRARRIAAHGLACFLVSPYLTESAEIETSQLLLRTLNMAPEPLRAEILLAIGSALRGRVLRHATISVWRESLARCIEAVSTETPRGSTLVSTPHLDLHRCFHAAGVATEALPELLRCIHAVPLTGYASEAGDAACTPAMTSQQAATSFQADVSTNFLRSFLSTLVSDLSNAPTVLRMLALDLLLERKASTEQWLAPLTRIQVADSRLKMLATCYETLLDVGRSSQTEQQTLLETYGQLMHLCEAILPILANAVTRQRQQHVVPETDHEPTAGEDYVTGARSVAREVLQDPRRIVLWTPATVSAAEAASDLAYASSRQDGEAGGFMHDMLAWVRIVPALSAARAIQLLQVCRSAHGAASLFRILRRHLDIETYFWDLRGTGDYFVNNRVWPSWLYQGIVEALRRLVIAPANASDEVPAGKTSLQCAFLSLDLACSSVVRDSIELQCRPASAELWLKTHALDFIAAILPKWPVHQVAAFLAVPQVQSQLRLMLTNNFSELYAIQDSTKLTQAPGLEWLAAYLTRRLRADFHRGLTVKLVSIYADLIAHLICQSREWSQASASSGVEDNSQSQALQYIENELLGILFDFDIPQVSVHRLLLRPLLLVLGSKRALHLCTNLILQCRSSADPSSEAPNEDTPALLRLLAQASKETRMAALWAVVEFGADHLPRVRVKTQVARASTINDQELRSVQQLVTLLESFFAPGTVAVPLALFMRLASVSQQALHYLQGVSEMIRRQLDRIVKQRGKRPRGDETPEMESFTDADQAPPLVQWASALEFLQRTRASAQRVARLIRPDAIREALPARCASARSVNQACARFVYCLEKFESECRQLDASLARLQQKLQDVPKALQDAVCGWLANHAPTQKSTPPPAPGLVTGELKIIFTDWEQAPVACTKARASTRRVCYLRSRNAYIDQVLRQEGADEPYADLEDFIAADDALSFTERRHAPATT